MGNRAALPRTSGVEAIIMICSVVYPDQYIRTTFTKVPLKSNPGGLHLSFITLTQHGLRNHTKLLITAGVMRKSTNPIESEHFEDVDLKHREEALSHQDEIDINDVAENKKLNRRLDLRVLPLCCWVYLLNFLDRGMLLLSTSHLSRQMSI